MSMDEIVKYLGVDSLGYLDVEGMIRATGRPANEFCLACFNGKYPLPVDPALDKFIMEKREARAKALVDQEPGTTTWFALRLGPSVFGIFDTFADDSGRQAHLSGKVAAALKEKAGDLFSKPPSIEKVDVIAAKLGGAKVEKAA